MEGDFVGYRVIVTDSKSSSRRNFLLLFLLLVCCCCNDVVDVYWNAWLQSLDSSMMYRIVDINIIIDIFFFSYVILFTRIIF